jgi:hypothetical protein
MVIQIVNGQTPVILTKEGSLSGRGVAGCISCRCSLLILICWPGDHWRALVNLPNPGGHCLNPGVDCLNAGESILNTGIRCQNTGVSILNTGIRCLNAGESIINTGIRFLNAGVWLFKRWQVLGRCQVFCWRSLSNIRWLSLSMIRWLSLSKPT